MSDIEKIELSSKIVFDKILKSQFEEFIDVLFKVDKAAYLDEGKDGFLDLYNYWNGVAHERGGMRRFNSKLIANCEKLKENE